MASVTGKEKKNGKGVRKQKSKKKSTPKEDSAGSQKLSKWERQREKQKLFKKLEDEKDCLQKEKKKVKSDRLEVEKKRRMYLEAKTENDRLVIKLDAEKDIWLERKKKKGHNFNKEFLINKVAGKIKEWETKGEEAKQEWINIERERAEMKEMEISLERDQKKFTIDRNELKDQKTEFDVKSKNLDEQSNQNEMERARLKDPEDKILDAERKLTARIEKYNSFDAVVKDREIVASQKEVEQNNEGIWLEKLKQQLLTILEKRSDGFKQQSTGLYEQISQMDGAFAELFSGIGENNEPEVVVHVE